MGNSCIKTEEEMTQGEVAGASESDPSQVSPDILPKSPSSPVVRVQVNVYALQVVNVHIQFGFGVFHSGVEVHGNEWAYGGHKYDLPGIYRMRKPRNLKSLSSIDGTFTFLKTLQMGTTERTLSEVVNLLRKLGHNWRGRDYHLFYKNCNHFAEAFVCELCGPETKLPEWINRSSRVLCNFPFLIEMIPPQYLSPPALQDSVKKELNYQEKKKKKKKSGDGKSTVKRSTSSPGDSMFSVGKSTASQVSISSEISVGTTSFAKDQLNTLVKTLSDKKKKMEKKIEGGEVEVEKVEEMKKEEEAPEEEKQEE